MENVLSVDVEWTTYGPPPPINVNKCFVVGCAKLAGVTVTKCAAV